MLSDHRQNADEIFIQQREIAARHWISADLRSARPGQDDACPIIANELGVNCADIRSVIERQAIWLRC